MFQIYGLRWSNHNYTCITLRYTSVHMLYRCVYIFMAYAGHTISYSCMYVHMSTHPVSCICIHPVHVSCICIHPIHVFPLPLPLPSVQVSSSLELLNLSHCPVDMDALCRVLQTCHHLQQLRLAAVGLDVDSVHSLCRYHVFL